MPRLGRVMAVAGTAACVQLYVRRSYCRFNALSARINTCGVCGLLSGGRLRDGMKGTYIFQIMQLLRDGQSDSQTGDPCDVIKYQLAGSTLSLWCIVRKFENF